MWHPSGILIRTSAIYYFHQCNIICETLSEFVDDAKLSDTVDLPGWSGEVGPYDPGDVQQGQAHGPAICLGQLQRLGNKSIRAVVQKTSEY